jgi:hypothetical protein
VVGGTRHLTNVESSMLVMDAGSIPGWCMDVKNTLFGCVSAAFEGLFGRPRVYHGQVQGRDRTQRLIGYKLVKSKHP